MFQHYLRMALRGFIRHKLYSFINLAGLSVALACAILILLFVRDQISYDAWIPGTQNLYRLALTFHLPGNPPWPLTQAPFPVITAAGEKIPQVKAAVHMVPEKMTVMVSERQGHETVTAVLVGILSGIYPALVLSGFRPASALKSGRGESSGSGLLRSALVVCQFAVSIAVGIAAIVIFRQISFARSLDPGFNRDDIVVIRNLINLSPDARRRLALVLRYE